MSTNPETKSALDSESKVIVNEALYEKFIYGLSFTSFTIGLAASIWFTRRKGSVKPPKCHFPQQNTLETKFTEDSMKEARLFALQTFGLGTLLCGTVFGSVVYGVSWATGASDVVSFCFKFLTLFLA
ncbi:Altered inheritance of mitochondria protein 11, variant 2 [Entomophthora muscae]|uniref:Altered inheritance of mitochondria protein 11, variant 2 n=1 Tax=Entomophthora muscae TaxID=34485 RepID=A0ACC2RFN4_9FUNG|nr:Altered inheritance of mitochondria protein 11, variant 2 [Entomophthora muscae]